ncbi:MAG: molybdenum cofactor biosynthesis protein MoaE [Dissulfurimicrobium sp.]|uniref:molybdenum cofactor biosynthesis protein MoaE n=1 Tax=Dissulfurimicrobium sp. TaxID=2022436 RepID=UPI0040493318
MNINSFLKKLKDIAGGKAGMILIHNGVVRGHSRDGRPISAVDIEVDRMRLDEIIKDAKLLPGIMAVEAEIFEGHFEVGDDIMLLGVAGDIRDNTISALALTLDRIKKEVTKKKEYYR